ncbi:outer membrane lipoprotein carrier protein LolA [Neorhizobium sp. P12A]|jgi:outer membrane lipoprotein-sorting protein|uniref:outer membrane lipoprotein carrier protein LolA n=1 Tax=Rhizobium/Agrobacterium group TaxID=227290 RepID=UPI0010449E18|nr:MULTISPECIES: outer membrane lipoprotein carrier protein LolA [Rhizobium/Agrobacterium group]KAA0698727.1 outer membrane lipoprotein carrier protein LolA [Neorhizobium sp. P12A]TCR90024.1 outer membrane lipoprotein-sorting protein [Rhizobium sp. BK376]
MKKTDARHAAGFSKSLTMTRRHLLGASIVVATLPLHAFAQASAAAAVSPGLAQAIADHFSAVKTMQGEFVQFGPRGDQTSGKFFIERPGKLRFNYDSPSPMRVIADGSNVVVGNVQLKTWDTYPLSKTPLSLLLASKIDLSADMVRSVKAEPALTTIVLGSRTIFGDSTITMMFDSKSYDLRQWTVTDNQGKDTSVVINNVKSNVSFDESVFRIPYGDLNSRSR